MGGKLIVIVGPSGAGKDTLIDWLRGHVDPASPIQFVRRTITRPAESGGETHDGVSPAGFERLKADGAFCVTWQAHGLSYGVPVSALEAVRAGNVAVVNGSRHALDAIREVFPAVHIVWLTVDSTELARRLVLRGRESEDEIAQRLARGGNGVPQGPDVTVIDNSGPVEHAGAALLRLIEDGW